MLNGEEKYWEGRTNRFVRWYFYVQKGLDLVNNFKYVGAAIFGLYFALKLTGWIILALMSIASILLLFVLGWLWVWKMAKIMDWLQVALGTHWSRYGYELQEKQIQLLEEIKKKLTLK